MRVFAVSDLHVDYDVNARWVEQLSVSDFCADILILAGDISDVPLKLERCLRHLARCFSKVLFVPGNHDLWVVRDGDGIDSLAKFALVRRIAELSGVSMAPLHLDTLSIVPLLSWYDFSFGIPDKQLHDTWMDFNACRWPIGWTVRDIAQHFMGLNTPIARRDVPTISFSHFLPRIDIMPWYIPAKMKMLYPVLGCAGLDTQIRALGASIHVYGHSHVNRKVRLDGVTYLNNAFAYPSETKIASKALKCIYETT